MSPPNYSLQTPEAGCYAEIYLPKKASYQGELYRALTEGFNHTKVIQHIWHNLPGVAEFMKAAEDFYDVDMLHNLPDSIPSYFSDLYVGYSMYEVDGVFKSTRGDGREPGIHEERTQVIRVMFKLDLAQVLSLLPPEVLPKDKIDSAEFLSRAYLRSHHWRRKEFLRDYICLGRRELDESQMDQILQHVEKWARCIGLFVFGYFVYLISRIVVEEEIWVAFFWNLIVARVSLIDARPHQERNSAQ